MTASGRYNSLEDYLRAVTLTVDGEIDDGFGATVCVKGREIIATVLFCDIGDFSKRTQTLNPTETLVFVNHFFTWITAEALQESFGIVDKYIGDEMMLVFSSEFGSENHFEEAIRAARRMGERDGFSFCPHIGIASGRVTVGYVGTPNRFGCSVYGATVTLAARCASVKHPTPVSSSIVFPDSEWCNRNFSKLFEPRKVQQRDGLWGVTTSRRSHIAKRSSRRRSNSFCVSLPTSLPGIFIDIGSRKSGGNARNIYGYQW